MSKNKQAFMVAITAAGIYALVHPETKDRFEPGVSKTVPLDKWLEGQIKAKNFVDADPEATAAYIAQREAEVAEAAAALESAKGTPGEGGASTAFNTASANLGNAVLENGKANTTVGDVVDGKASAGAVDGKVTAAVDAAAVGAASGAAAGAAAAGAEAVKSGSKSR